MTNPAQEVMTVSRIDELIDAAEVAVDDHQYERAQALAQIAQAAALAVIGGHLANIVAALHNYNGMTVADSLGSIAAEIAAGRPN